MVNPENEEIIEDIIENSVIDNHSHRNPTYNLVRLTNTVLVSNRYRISSRAAAALAYSVLKDYCVITEENTVLIIDKCKVNREKKS